MQNFQAIVARHLISVGVFVPVAIGSGAIEISRYSAPVFRPGNPITTIGVYTVIYLCVRLVEFGAALLIKARISTSA